MAYTQAVTVTATSNSALLPSTQTNWPTLVKLSATELKTVANGGQIQNTVTFNAQTVPADFACWSDAGYTTPCKFDGFSYDGVAGVYWLVVKVPSLALSTVLYFTFGDASVTLYQGGAVGDAWPSAWLSVQHCANGSSLSLLDSTANGLNGTNHSATATTGQVNGGMGLSGSSQYATLPNGASLAGRSAASIACWYKKAANPSGNAGMMYESTTSSGFSRFAMFTSPTGDFLGVMRDSNAGSSFAATETNPFTIGTQYRCVLTLNGNNLLLYRNGTQVASNTAAKGAMTSGAPGDPIGLGAFTQSGALSYINGTQDEHHISTATWTPDQVTIDYQSQLSPTTFWTQGSVTPVGSGIFPGLLLLGAG